MRINRYYVSESANPGVAKIEKTRKGKYILTYEEIHYIPNKEFLKIISRIHPGKRETIKFKGKTLIVYRTQ